MGRLDDERAARTVLAAIAEPGDERIAAAIGEHSATRLLVGLRGGGHHRRPEEGVSASRAALTPSARARLDALSADQILQATADAGARVIIPADSEWPTQLNDLPAPPIALWVRGAGDARLALIRAVALVGSRAATAYGERVSSLLSSDLAAMGWTIVSGGAHGVDASSHRGAMAVGGTTAVILAGGVDVPYPRTHAALFDRVLETGGFLISESPPGVLPRQHRFLERNRLIAALTRGTVVVEAALRSGARATANRAADLGRPVMAVPGPVTSIQSGGTNDLIRRGHAEAVMDAGHIVDCLVPACGTLRQRDPMTMDVWSQLSSAEMTEEELLARLDLPAAELAVRLAHAEICGLARRRRRGWVRGDAVPE